MPNVGVDWTGAWTLRDFVIDLFKQNKIDSDEFRLLIRVYGRDKLITIWKDYKTQNKEDVAT